MGWLDDGADYPPPGRTRVTFDEAQALLVEHPRFAQSTTRPGLWERLIDYVTRFLALEAEHQDLLDGQPLVQYLWLGGSFVSGKVDPRNIDLSVALDTELPAPATRRRRPAVPTHTGRLGRLVAAPPRHYPHGSGQRATDARHCEGSPRIPGGDPVTNPLRRRLLDSRREQLDAWRAEQDQQPIPTSDELDDADRRNYLGAVRAYDSQATLTEELVAHLVGELPEGALPADLGSALLGPLDKTVAEAGGGDNVHLELVGISRGSTVLHFRPTVPAVDAVASDNGQLAVDLPLTANPTGDAITQAFRLIDATERHEDVARWSNALAPLSKVVDALETYDATLDLAWYTSDGRIARSRLSATGRAYLRRLREETHVHTMRRTLSGTIVELKAAEATFVRIKQSPAHTAPSYEIRFENRQDLVDLHLELDAQVAIVVEEIETTDGTGQRRGIAYRFSRLAGGPTEPLAGS